MTRFRCPYVATWFFMAASLRGGIEDWFVERRAEGYMARYAKLELGGFPFRLRARLDGPALGWSDPRANWASEAERMVAETRPWSPGRLVIVYGPFSMRANGTLALDAEMEPIGAFTAKARGFFGLIDALQAKGLMRAGDAVTAKMVLGILSRKPARGGPPTLSLPVTLSGPPGLRRPGGHYPAAAHPLARPRRIRVAECDRFLL